MNGLLGWKKYAERFNSSGRKLQGVEKPIRAAQVLRSLDSDSLLAYDEFVLAEMLELEVSYAHQLEGIYFNPKFKIELRKEQRDKNPDKLQTLIERNLGWRLGIALKLSRKDTGLLSDIHRKLTIPFDDLKQVFN